MKKLLLVNLVILMTSFVQSQIPPMEWIEQTGGQGGIVGRCVYSDALGNVYTCGNFSGQVDLDPGADDLLADSQGLDDLFIQKFDPTGNLLWALALGASGEDKAYCITTDSNGDVLVTGHFEGSIAFDQSNPGNYTSSLGNLDVFVLKLDSDGNFIFVKTMGGGSSGRAFSIVTDELNQIYLGGQFSGSVDFDPGIDTEILAAWAFDMFLLKLDEMGNFIWVKKSEGGTDEKILDIELDSDNNILVTGSYSDGSCDFDPGPESVVFLTWAGSSSFLLKFDNDGILIWARELSSTLGSFSQSLCTDSHGNIFVAGNFAGTLYSQPGSSIPNLDATGPENAFIEKFDANGLLLSLKKLDGDSETQLYSISRGVSDGIYITGSYCSTSDFDPGDNTYWLSSMEGCDMFIEKLNGDLEFEWVQTIGIWDYAMSNFVGTTNPAGDVFLLGRFRDTISSFPVLGPDLISEGLDDLLLVKFNAAASVENQDQPFIKIYPNPTDGLVNVDLSNLTTHTLITIYDVTGKVIYTREESEKQLVTLNLAEYERGVYNIVVWSNSIDETYRLIKY